VKKNKIRKLLDAPFSNKVLALTSLYWRVKTRFYYRFMFKSFGNGSVILRPMLIRNADCIEIADHVSIRDGVRLEAVRDPFGRTPFLTIGSNTLIEQDVQIVCHSRVKIGRDVSIAGRCAIVDVTHPYEDVGVGNIGNHIANENSFVEIGDGAFLGYGAVVLPNVRIGERAVIGANSVVTRDVPAFSIAAGAPARVVRVYSPELQRWVQPVLGTPNR
jgi:acetyltransferase-like isoleucine patch superfamily enzyme